MTEKRVLVVDDEDSIRHVLRSLLEKKGCTVDTAASAEEAIEIIDRTTPEVALVDFVLPGENGLAVLEHLKERHKNTRVVMITSQGSDQRSMSCLGSGAFGYLEKPFTTLDEIWETVSRALEAGRPITATNPGG